MRQRKRPPGQDQLKRAALYLRVSTRDKQEPGNQMQPLRDFASRMQFHPQTIEYVDHATATNSDRPQFKEMMKAATRGLFEVVIVWSLDRFSREGVAETFAHIRRLKDNRVDFYSITEEHFRTNGPAGELLIAIAAWIAEAEARRLRERIAAGIEYARQQGKRIGRPPKEHAEHSPEELAISNQAGTRLRDIAQATGLSTATLSRRIRGYLATLKTDRAKQQFRDKVSKVRQARWNSRYNYKALGA